MQKSLLAGGFRNVGSKQYGTYLREAYAQFVIPVCF